MPSALACLGTNDFARQHAQLGEWREHVGLSIHFTDDIERLWDRFWLVFDDEVCVRRRALNILYEY